MQLAFGKKQICLAYGGARVYIFSSLRVIYSKSSASSIRGSGRLIIQRSLLSRISQRDCHVRGDYKLKTEIYNRQYRALICSVVFGFGWRESFVSSSCQIIAIVFAVAFLTYA